MIRPIKWAFLAISALVSVPFLWIDSGIFLDEATSRGQIIGRDFTVFWSASALLQQHDFLTILDPNYFRPALDAIMGMKLAYMPYPYPPHSLFLVWPLALFPYPLSLILWLGLTFVFLAVILRRDVDRMSLVLLLLAPASAVNLSTGQNGFLSAALLCGGLLTVERRPVLAGILFGLLSYKPQLGLLIPILLALNGNWRCFITASATVLLLIGLSFICFGTEAWEMYLEKSGPQQFDLLARGSGLFQAMTPTYFMSARLSDLPQWLGWLLQGINAALAIAGTIWVYRQKIPVEMKAAIAMVAIVMIPPYVLTYDMTIVAVAIMLAIGRDAGALDMKRAGEALAMALCWSVPVLVLMMPAWLGPVSVTLLFLLMLLRSRATA